MLGISSDEKAEKIVPAPGGLALLMALGPGLVWCGEYIGSGEVILATRSGAIFGVAILWAPVIAIFAKYWIGLAGAHYTVTTGEGMIDMLGRTPGPKNWVVWPVFIGQVCSGAISTGALASVTAVFLHYFVPLRPFLLGWAAVLVVIAITWSGRFGPLKQAMSLLVLLIIIGTMTVAIRTWPGTGALLGGLFEFKIPEAADWAIEKGIVKRASWFELMPLLGWAAGGFASQVWYSYWVIGAGYGMSRGRGHGVPADPDRLHALTVEEAREINGWRRVVTADATMALVIGTVVTSAFLMAGNGVLRPQQLAPEKTEVALTVARLFSEHWGHWGADLFVLAGLAAMMSTMLGQFAGWPRLLADCARLLFPATQRWPWKTQFRFILIVLALTNLVIVYSLGYEPVLLVQTAAILDGMLLTPLQALAVGLTLYFVMPRFFSEEVRPLLRANKVFVFGLGLAFVVFGYFCVFQLGQSLMGK